MKKLLENRFNQEVEHYRKTLLHYARISDWKTFELKAGSFFDYMECVELSETKRRFLRTFSLILLPLIVFFIAVLLIHDTVRPELLNLKVPFTILVILGICYELNFFLNFRLYIEKKMIYYRKRKQTFVQLIKRDFKEIFVREYSR